MMEVIYWIVMFANMLSFIALVHINTVCVCVFDVCVV